MKIEIRSGLIWRVRRDAGRLAVAAVAAVVLIGGLVGCGPMSHAGGVWGRHPMFGGSSNDAAIRRAIEKDHFPSAKQAGVPNSVPKDVVDEE